MFRATGKSTRPNSKVRRGPSDGAIVGPTRERFATSAACMTLACGPAKSTHIATALTPAARNILLCMQTSCWLSRMPTFLLPPLTTIQTPAIKVILSHRRAIAGCGLADQQIPPNRMNLQSYAAMVRSRRSPPSSQSTPSS